MGRYAPVSRIMRSEVILEAFCLGERSKTTDQGVETLGIVLPNLGFNAVGIEKMRWMING